MSHRLLRFVLSFVLFLSVLAGFGASTPALARTPQAQGVKPNFGYDPDTGRLISVSAPAGQPIPASQLGFLAAEGSMGFVKMYSGQFGLSDPARELVSQAAGSGTFGSTRVARYQQVYNGVPVFGGNMVVSTTKAGALLGMQGKIRTGLNMNVAAPTGSDVQAQDAARALVLKTYGDKYGIKAGNVSTGAASLWIYDEKMFTDSKLEPQLVWKVEVKATNGMPVDEVVLVNAETGKVAVSYNQIDEQWALPKGASRIAGTGGTAISLTGGTPLWRVYSANNADVYPRDSSYTFMCDETSLSCPPDQDTLHARQYALDTYDFYWSVLSRDSIDGAGLRIVNNVHLSVNYQNAFWDGSEMYYGDGFPVDDVIGHELTHGVTQNTSGLIYMFQPGAINESLSDVFGQLIDLSNNDDIVSGCDTNPTCRWLLGEDIAGPSAAIRDMKNPPHFGDPDKMSSSLYYKLPFDNGGVHTNSGVNNKVAYLLTDGGTFNAKTVLGLGIPKVAHIYYQAQTARLFPSADYVDLYYALNGACDDLVGSFGITDNDCLQVLNATQAVQMNKRFAALSGPVVTACPPGQVYGHAQFKDDFESGTANWGFGGQGLDSTFSPVSITPSWTTAIGYQGSKTNHSLYAPGPDGLNQCDLFGCTLVAAQEWAQLASPLSIPTGKKTYLTFDHMYLFETDKIGSTWYYFDGGVLEWSPDGGLTWFSAKPFFNAGVNYNGTIFKAGPVPGGFYSSPNPLRGFPAFVGGSRNDSLTLRYNLSSLAGQNILLRYRVGYDSFTWQGWFIDNVDIHTCVALPAKPLLQAPATGSHPVAANPLTLNWSDVAGATSYEVEVDDNVDFSSPLIDQNTGLVSSYVVTGGTLSALDKYYWRVRSLLSTDLGDQSKGWTGAWNLTPK